MTFCPAWYDSSCANCGKEIRIGDLVYVDEDNDPVCEECIDE